VITWLSEIPVYIPAVAVIPDTGGAPDETISTPIVILVPADQLDKLRVGQNVVFKFKAAPQTVMAKIFAVEPEVLSLQAAQKRFDPSIRFSNIREPKAVALARLVPSASGAWLFDHGGGSFDAWIQTDSKPVLSLFPLTGRVLQPPDDPGAIGSVACSGLARESRVSRGEFSERCSLQASSCLLREKSLQINQQQIKGGSLYV